jgi:5-methylcytosine-specific restriction endonuclease McrA
MSDSKDSARPSVEPSQGLCVPSDVQGPGPAAGARPAGVSRKQSPWHVLKRMESKARTLARRPKPYDGEWLRARYVTDGLDCVQIGTLLSRDPKTVWTWLKFYGVPTRPRGINHIHLPKDGSTFRGKHHTPEFCEEMRQRRLRDKHAPYLRNEVHWLHTPGAVHPNWKGGITAERQAFYAGDEWRGVARQVYTRDKRTCQRCGKVKGSADPFDIHHIVSFMCVELRAVLSNLVLLCESCHYWVHGLANTTREFIRCQ